MPESTAPDDETFDIEGWISGATRPEETIVLSSKGHEYGQYQALELQLQKAQQATDSPSDDRLVSSASTEPVRIAKEMEALAKVITLGRQAFRLRGVSEPDLKAMRAKTDDMDEEETTPHLLALACIDPVISADQWSKLRVVLGEGQWTQLIRVANRVSFGEVPSVPFSVAASVALRLAAA